MGLLNPSDEIYGSQNKWIGWIKACLTSAKASILVNGCPTDEFRLEKGLRQGDMLSHFLLILVMEGLHLAIEDGF